MPNFSTQNRIFQTSGLALFLLQISLFVFALKPFHYGTWYQVEPMMLALYMLAALNALWLAVGFWRGWLGLVRPVHPLLWCMLAWVGWQWVATAFAPLPWQSWFGPPGIGEGASYYTALLLSFLLASALWKKSENQKIILTQAAFNLVIMAYLHIDLEQMCKVVRGPGREATAAGNWPDYLVFLIAYFWIAFMGTPASRTPSRHVWTIICVSAIIIFIADNGTAKMLMPPTIIVGSLVLWLSRTHRPAWLVPGKFWRWLGVLGCFSFVVWIINSDDSKYTICADTSISTRALFNQVAVKTIENEPQRLLMGTGWGNFSNDLFKHAMVDGLHSFNDGQPARNWHVLNAFSHHSHNEPLEVVLSLGIIGLILWLAMPIAAILTVSRQKFWWCVPMLLCVTTIQSFWFFLPHVLAYQALSWVVLASGWRRHVQSTRPLHPLRPAAYAVLVVAVLMAWTASAQLEGITYGQKLSRAIKESPDDYSVEWLLQDMKRGGDRLIEATRYFLYSVQYDAADRIISPESIRWYSKLMQATHQAADLPQANAWVASQNMMMHTVLFSIDDAGVLSPLKPNAAQTIEESVIRIAKLAPEREDVVAQFLFSLDGFTKGDKARQKHILERILAVAPNHRGALWLMGQHLSKIPGKEQEGRAMQRRALDTGLERVYPITRAEVRAFEAGGN